MHRKAGLKLKAPERERCASFAISISARINLDAVLGALPVRMLNPADPCRETHRLLELTGGVEMRHRLSPQSSWKWSFGRLQLACELHGFLETLAER